MNDISGFDYMLPGRPLFPEPSVSFPEVEFITALTSGGDSRLAVDPHTGVNKYGCPPKPAPRLICASSCTATPIAARGFEKAAEFYVSLIAAGSPRQRPRLTRQRHADIVAALLRYFGVAGIADAFLCPSGTNALSTAAALLARERPGEAMTAILPEASETGAGVPLAVAGQWFDGPAPPGAPPPAFVAGTIEIPLRSADGIPRSEDELVDAYATARANAPGRPILYLTHSTKTGLIAPVEPSSGIDVIVDASQGRIEPSKVAAFIQRGWPVVVTGSKFFGGPAFAGAVLFPTARLPACATPQSSPHAAHINLGMVLRWIAAIDVIEEFAVSAARIPILLEQRGVIITRAISANPALLEIGGLEKRSGGWSDLPGIFTFAVRDPVNPRRLLPAAELRPLYQGLMKQGILLGQPVSLGRFGGLRIAIGARDLLPGTPLDGGLPQVFAALHELTRS